MQLLMRPSIPRLPLVPDPLRRIHVATDLEAVTDRGAETSAEAGGMSHDQVDRIWSAITDLYRSGVHPAIQLCVRRDGEVVLDRAIGHARGNGPSDSRDAPKVPALASTPFCVYSASKAITAVVIHLLDERGALHIADRVSDYIPEYAQNGKRSTTIGHVLAHRAGVPRMPEEISLEQASDPDVVVDAICRSRATLRPGRQLAYHAISGGFVLGEIVRRVTGKTIREVLHEEILAPLGFRWNNYGVAAADLDQVGLDYVTGPPVLPPISTLLVRALGAPLGEIVEAGNDDRFRQAIIPAGNVITTANELSRFFELLRQGGELDGVRILEPRTIRRALTEQSYMELDLSLGFPTRFSLGFMLGSRTLGIYGPHTSLAFGHLGFVNIIGWADPERLLSAAIITSGKPIVYPELLRFLGVMRRIAKEVPKVPRSTLEL